MTSGENNRTAVRPHRAQRAIWSAERSIAMAAHMGTLQPLAGVDPPEMIPLYWLAIGQKASLLDRDTR